MEIKKLEILDFTENLLKVKIECSSGTYIRSIARDLGISTGYYGFLKNLVRSKVSHFSLENTYNMDDIETDNFQLISPYDILNLEPLEINPQFIPDLRNGKKPLPKWFNDIYIKENIFLKVHYQKELLAIIIKKDNQLIYDLVF